MKAGIVALAVVCVVLHARAGDGELHAKVENGFVRITAGERPVLLYRYEGAPKPYVKELYTPGGVQVLLDSPPDHVHHHGLMFALAVNGVNFWEETEKAGKEVNVQIVAGGQSSVGLIEEIEWRSQQAETLLREERMVFAYRQEQNADAGVVLVVWRSTVGAPYNVAEVQLTGSHYFGLGMRFVRSMDKDGTFILSDKAEGEVVRGDEQLYSGRWCAYAASVDGKPVTVAMFNHPSNVPPATWFTMKDPFAYLSATLKLHKEPLTLKGERRLSLTYGIAAWDGRTEPAQIEKAYRLWLQLCAMPATQRSESPLVK